MPTNTIKQFLHSLPKEEVIYYRANPGNAGDALIASGAFKLFKECKLNIKVLDPKNFDARGKTVIYSGGGNLVGIYPEARNFFFQHHKCAKQLILLPHTIAGNEDLLGVFGGNVTLFARENVSYAHIKKYALNANLFLDHDLALELDPVSILESPSIGFLSALYFKGRYKLRNDPRAIHIPSIYKMLDNTFFETFSYLRNKNCSANFFRDDVERLSENMPKNNVDLSTVYEYGTKNEELTRYTTKRLMAYINRFSRIRTDRLHICIAAALLNKEVEFYSNSYFKCQAVYDYSLKDKFENIKWMGIAEK